MKITRGNPFRGIKFIIIHYFLDKVRKLKGAGQEF